MYKKIDQSFFKPKKAHKVIDKRWKKVEINHGVPYISTSLNEVFEIRKEGRSLKEQEASLPSNYDQENDSETEILYNNPRIEPNEIRNQFIPDYDNEESILDLKLIHTVS